MGFQERELSRVTIMMPARNEGLAIGETLRAMVELDYPKERLEVLLLNDGSTGGSEVVAKRFEREYLSSE